MTSLLTRDQGKHQLLEGNHVVVGEPLQDGLELLCDMDVLWRFFLPWSRLWKVGTELGGVALEPADVVRRSHQNFGSQLLALSDSTLGQVQRLLGLGRKEVETHWSHLPEVGLLLPAVLRLFVA